MSGKGVMLLAIILLVTLSFATANSEHTTTTKKGAITTIEITPYANTLINGIYEPVNTNITTIDCEYDYCAKTPIYTADFSNNPTSTDSIKTSSQGESIYYTPKKLEYIGNGRQQLISQPNNQATLTYKDNKVFYENIYGQGLTLTYEFTPSMLKEGLIINSLSELPTPRSNLGANPELSLEFLIRTSMDIKDEKRASWNKNDNKRGKGKNDLLSGNKKIFTLPTPIAIDSSGEVIELDYEFKRVGANLFVSIITPYEWLQSANYPVIIDPTTELPINETEMIINFSEEENPISNIIIHNATSGSISIDTGVDRFAIDPTTATFTNAEVTIKEAIGNELWKCPSWNFTTRTCTLDDWELHKILTIGEPYVVIINSSDPSYIEYFSDPTEKTNSGTTYINSATLTKTLPLTQPYLILGYRQLTINSSSNSVLGRTKLNGNVVNLNRIEPNNANRLLDYRPILQQTIATLPNESQLLELDFANEDSGTTAYSKNNLIYLQDIDHYYRLNRTNQFTVSATSYNNYLSGTYTAEDSGKYLLIVTLDYTSGNSADSIHGRLTINGFPVGEVREESKDPTDFRNMATHSQLDLIEGVNYTLGIDAYCDGGTNCAMRNVEVTLTNIDEHSDFYTSESYTTTTSTSESSKIAFNHTKFHNQSQYLVLMTGFARSIDSDSTSAITNFLIDGTSECSVPTDPKDTNDYMPVSCMKIINTTSPYITGEVTLKSENSGQTVSLGALRISVLPLTCEEDWIPIYTNITSCSVNNTYQNMLTYEDENNCYYTTLLPTDNGTITENYCNYCDSDWIDVGTGCLSNSSQYLDYIDLNGCYSQTGLTEDEPPIDDETWTSCDYNNNDFTCYISDEPYINDKMEYTCTLPTGTFECINTITYGFDDVLQVNPQKTEKTDGVFSFNRNIESRESFTTRNGLLNAYFTKKNLLADNNFVITTYCSNETTTITHQKQITPTIKNLDSTNTWLLWGKRNIPYLFIILLLLILGAMLIGSLIKHSRGR